MKRVQFIEGASYCEPLIKKGDLFGNKLVVNGVGNTIITVHKKRHKRKKSNPLIKIANEKR